MSYSVHDQQLRYYTLGQFCGRNYSLDIIHSFSFESLRNIYKTIFFRVYTINLGISGMLDPHNLVLEAESEL